MILICGSGPTGLVLAICLQQRNIPYRLIDQKNGPTTHSKALGIQARTLEVFDKIGCIAPFLEKGIQSDRIEIQCGDKNHLLHLDSINSPYPFVLVLPQSDTETILLNFLEKLGGKVEWNTSLDHVERDKFSWIIGCDGAHSRLRELMDLEFRGSAFPENFFLADVEIDAPLCLDGPLISLQSQGLSAVLPLYKGGKQFRLIFPLKEHETFENSSAETLNAFLIGRGCLKWAHIRAVIWTSTFRIHRRHVSHMRKNNMILAGDAAHIHSPIGGQGMNTSIQDALNLGWKLALELEGVAAKNLMDSFEKERLPIAKSVLKGTTRATHLITFFSRTGLTSIFNCLLFFIQIKWVRKWMAKNISELALNYKNSPINLDSERFSKGPKVGSRAPDVTLQNGSSLFTLLRTPKFVILLFEENAHFVQKLLPFSKWVDILVMHDSNLMKTYRAKNGSLYVVRPDGVIGYRAKKIEEEEVFKYLLRNFKPLF